MLAMNSLWLGLTVSLTSCSPDRTGMLLNTSSVRAAWRSTDKKDQSWIVCTVPIYTKEGLMYVSLVMRSALQQQ